MHVPVLLKETIELLKPEKGAAFVDGTVGFGGHTIQILKTNPKASVLGIDLDQASLDKLRELLIQQGLAQRCRLVHGNYRDIDKFLQENNFSPDGILLDLGFSSAQVDFSERGFSFQSEGPLDMRFDTSSSLTAKEVINTYYERDLVRIFSEYGEEKFSKRIAKAVVEARKKALIVTTLQLAETIRSAIPASVRFKVSDNLRRIFQAIRIEVNSELDNLKAFLPKAVAALPAGGRLVIISFHSLEDRIVKDFFNEQAKDCVCPPEFPTCICGKASTLRVLTRKPVTASDEEVSQNPRSKPAKLRAAEKIM